MKLEGSHKFGYLESASYLNVPSPTNGSNGNDTNLSALKNIFLMDSANLDRKVDLPTMDEMKNALVHCKGGVIEAAHFLVRNRKGLDSPENSPTGRDGDLHVAPVGKPRGSRKRNNMNAFSSYGQDSKKTKKAHSGDRMFTLNGSEVEKEQLRKARSQLKFYIGSKEGSVGDWRVQVCQTLQAKPSGEIFKQLDAVEKLLIKIHARGSNDTAMEIAISDCVNCLNFLPKQGNRFDGIVNSISPNSKMLEEYEQDAKVRYEQLVATESLARSEVKVEPGTQANKDFGAIPKQAVDVLSRICSGYAERIVKLRNVRNDDTLARQRSMSNMKDFIQSLADRLKANQLSVKTATEELQVRQKNVKDEMARLDSKVLLFMQTNLRPTDPYSTDDELKNIAAIECSKSKDSGMIAVFQALENAKTARRQQQNMLASYSEQLIFIENLSALMNIVAELATAASNELTKQLINLQTEECKIAKQRIEYLMPRLCNALLRFNAFHAERKRLADVRSATLRDELDMHCKYFPEEAKDDRDATMKRISTYQGIIMKSGHDLRTCAVEQRELWEGLLLKLPKDIQDFITNSYRSVCKDVGGQFQASFADFFSAVSDTPKSHSEAEVPVPAAPSIKVEAMTTSNAYKLGDRLYTRFLFGNDDKLIGGEVIKVHPDDKYDVKYDDGDIHRSLGRHQLYTEKELVDEFGDIGDISEWSGNGKPTSNAGCILM